MAGKAARVAVEPSGSEGDTMERLGRATWPVGRAHDLGGVFSGRAQRELPRYNGATGASDMAGYAAR